MRLDEFETVGNTVKAFASDNATVVIGTSMDPEMSDELRVTVVATGIGNERKPDITLVTNAQSGQAPAEPKKAQPLQEKPQAATPAAKEQPAASSSNAAPKSQTEHDYLDIPAFLRKQAD
jgi:cell division protein FtsZ